MDKLKNFNPLTFLASLGAGGIAVAPFVYFQYTQPHGKGLITIGELMSNATSHQIPFFYFLISIMIVFASIHFGLTIKLLGDLTKWSKLKEFKILKQDPLKNTGLLAPFISLAMSFNVVIGVVRFFVPAIHSNFQAMMLPALIAWGILWLWLMRTEINLLKIAFSKNFDVSKISFGWLLHPFALAMVSVTGTGIAAMAKDPTIAHIAAFLSSVSGIMGLFLFLVKVVSIFTSHFNMKGVPERQFLPSFLIVIPITTLFAIMMFRFGHYMEHQFGYHLDSYFTFSILLPFAFEVWYFIFGLAMLKDYFKKDFFRKEYYVTLWAFICPFVGFSVLGSFMYKFFVPNPVTQIVVIASVLVAVTFYAFISNRFFKYEYKKDLNLVKA